MSKSSRRPGKRPTPNQIEKVTEETTATPAPVTQAVGVTRNITAHHSGPIPPPDMLARYDEVVPNGAERIFAMAEGQAAHRISLEKTVIEGDSRRAWWGLHFAFAMGLAILTSGSTIALTVSPKCGSSIIIATLVSVVGTFVYGHQTRRKERERKAELKATISTPSDEFKGSD